MRNVYVVAAALCLVSAGAVAQAPRPAPEPGFSAEELDRMSQRDLQEGAHRGFASGPRPPTTTATIPVHQPRGLWVCKSTDQYVPILAAPQLGARVIGQSSGRVAAGADTGAFTSVLYHEGLVGYLPMSAIRPYRNEFDSHASCRFTGLGPTGIVMFNVR